jgi:hypothetical protein
MGYSDKQAKAILWAEAHPSLAKKERRKKKKK